MGDENNNQPIEESPLEFLANEVQVYDLHISHHKFYSLRVRGEPYRTTLPDDFRQLAKLMWEKKEDLNDLHDVYKKYRNSMSQLPEYFEIFRVNHFLIKHFLYIFFSELMKKLENI